MAHAIFKAGGKQYRVTEGDRVDVDILDAKVGDSTTFDQVVMISDGDASKVGTPLVDGASVTAEVVDQFRAKKVIAFKYKRRKGYHRRIGHRAHLTKVQIKSING